MKVQDLMTRTVICCAPDTNLAAAAALMWNNDCGVLPVLDDGKLVGIVTDRDICIALGTRNVRASDIQVRDVATRNVETCEPDADVHEAMLTMRRAKVRRLPVVKEGKLRGILALNDIVRAVDRRYRDLQHDEVMKTMKAICEHRGEERLEPAAATADRHPIPVAAPSGVA